MTNDTNPNGPEVLSPHCTGRVGNAACREAHRAGRSVHIIPPRSRYTIVDDRAQLLDPILILPTYHFATVEEGLAAVRDAMATAPTVATDDDLYAYRAAGIAHYLPVGWVDPTRR